MQKLHSELHDPFVTQTIANSIPMKFGHFLRSFNWLSLLFLPIFIDT